MAVYLLDLDGFKPVNDQHGHDVGDELLRAVAHRLRAQIPASDMVARLGGDEFVLMSRGLRTEADAQRMGQRLLTAFAQPFQVGLQRLQVGLTIGYAVAPLDGHEAVELIKAADAAMYCGKQEGKHCLRRAAGWV